MNRWKKVCQASVVVLVWVVLVGSVGSASAQPAGVNLAAMADWDIVIAAGASVSEVYAAREFQQYFHQAGGPELPIVRQSQRADRHVFICASQAMMRSPVGFSVDDFGDEDLRIVVRDHLIAIAGGRPRGTLYGVYTFLEDHVGVRFLTTDHTHVPQIGTWQVIGPEDRFYHPPLSFRWSFYKETNANPPFATKLRTNTVGTGCTESVASDPKLGGKTDLKLVNHSFLYQISSLEYGEEHPEYFCVRDGRRWLGSERDRLPQNKQNQPCMTNPDVLRIVTDAALKELATSYDYNNISLGQNDNDKYCQCPDCEAINTREGTPMGSQLTFVNAVADKVAEKYPDNVVGTMAYGYARKPPKTIRPRPNVHIQLCSVECCVIHALDDPSCPLNVDFCHDLNTWDALTTRGLGIWHYNINFSDYLLPCPNLRVIDDNIKYFVKQGVRAVFMQSAGNAISGELSDLRNYMISSLLWDPSRDGQKVMDEFLNLHYGKAAPAIRRYIDLINDAAQASGRHHNCFGPASRFGLEDPALAEAALDAFAEAVKLADNETIRNRVEKASLGAYRLAIEPVWRLRREDRLDPDLAQRMRPLVKRYFELCATHKVGIVTSTGDHVGKARKRLESLLDL